MPLIFQGLINFCWFLFKWGLLASVLGVAIAAAYLYRQADEKIRRRVEEAIARHYQGLKVTVRAARLVKTEGIELSDLSVVDPGQHGPGAELLHVEELVLHGRGDLEELLTGRFEIGRVSVRSARLRATRRPDGTWSTTRLLPLPDPLRGCPAAAGILPKSHTGSGDRQLKTLSVG